MTAETLTLVVAALLSLLFSYVPGFATWYQALKPDTKRLLMAGMLVVVVGAIFGLACAALYTAPGVTCSAESAWKLVELFVLALMANQGTYRLSPRIGYIKEEVKPEPKPSRR